jgi:thiamine transport system ATP-binding protein
VLAVDDLTVRFGAVAALDRVTLEVPDGELLVVLGPSGSGKSTLLRAVAGLEEPTTGGVRFDDVDVTALPTHRRGFALMFQDGQLFPNLSIADNVGYPLRIRRVPRAERAARVEELLELVGLPDHGGRVPGELSGGEQQRVALARALAVRPRLLLLDEPLSALDRGLRERLAAELRAILRHERITSMLVTHDHEEAFAVADRIAVLRTGRLVQSGTATDVWRRPVDAETARFLGYAAVLDGDPAARLLRLVDGRRPEGWVALRRSALRVDREGPLQGTVVSVRSTPEQTRLVVDVVGLGRLDAVAGLDVPLRAGEPVRVSVDASRLAVVSP